MSPSEEPFCYDLKWHCIASKRWMGMEKPGFLVPGKQAIGAVVANVLDRSLMTICCLPPDLAVRLEAKHPPVKLPRLLWSRRTNVQCPVFFHGKGARNPLWEYLPWKRCHALLPGFHLKGSI